VSFFLLLSPASLSFLSESNQFMLAPLLDPAGPSSSTCALPSPSLNPCFFSLPSFPPLLEYEIFFLRRMCKRVSHEPQWLPLPPRFEEGFHRSPVLIFNPSPDEEPATHSLTAVAVESPSRLKSTHFQWLSLPWSLSEMTGGTAEDRVLFTSSPSRRDLLRSRCLYFPHHCEHPTH